LALVAAIRDRWPPVALLVTSGQVRPAASALPSGARFVDKPYAAHQLKAEFDTLLSGHA